MATQSNAPHPSWGHGAPTQGVQTQGAQFETAGVGSCKRRPPTCETVSFAREKGGRMVHSAAAKPSFAPKERLRVSLQRRRNLVDAGRVAVLPLVPFHPSPRAQGCLVCRQHGSRTPIRGSSHRYGVNAHEPRFVCASGPFNPSDGPSALHDMGAGLATRLALDENLTCDPNTGPTNRRRC